MTIGHDKRWRVILRCHKRCVRCGLGVADGVALTMDHIKPRSRGGTDEERNLQAMCEPCNNRKGSNGW